MIRINLLPHREAKRKQNKIAFFRMLAIAGVFAGAVVFAVGMFIGELISQQDQRNDFIKNANKELDRKIAEIATLKDEIDALKARQQAVEDLQSDRNQPVYLLDELVKYVPEGVYLKSLKQEGQKVSLLGVAQSNEKVAELLHNLTSESAWLERPELVEIKASTIAVGKDNKKVFEFTMGAGIKRPTAVQDKDKAKGDKPGDTSKAPDANKPAPTTGLTTPAPDNKATAPAVPAPVANDKGASAKVVATDAGGTGAASIAPKKP